MPGVLDLLQAALQNPEALLKLPQAMGRGAPSLPGDWKGPPGFWRDLPTGDIPAQPPWTLGGDNVVLPPFGVGANAAGIYGRASAPMDNRDVVLPPEGGVAAALPNAQAGNPDFPRPGMPQVDPMGQKRSLYDIIRRFHEGVLPAPLSEAIQGRTYDQGRSSALRVSMGPPPRPLLGSPQEYAARQQPGREQALMNEIFAGRMFGPQGGVVSDGDYPAGWGSGLRGNAYPARPSPLNQFMPGAGLY